MCRKSMCDLALLGTDVPSAYSDSSAGPQHYNLHRLYVRGRERIQSRSKFLNQFHLFHDKI